MISGPAPEVAGGMRDADAGSRGRRVRALLVAEQCDPESVSVPLIGWNHSRAIAKLSEIDAHVVTQIRYAEKLRRSGASMSEYSTVDSEAVARPIWRLEGILRGGAGKGWTTVMALRSISYAYFERVLWRKFARQIRASDFDIVHRITPLSPTVAGSLASRCKRAGVPFVVGPINGGVPWPRAFDSTRRREREWLSYVRGGYRLNPAYRSTRESAAAIIVGSLDTLRQEPERYHSKCVYIPENAIDPLMFAAEAEERQPTSPMRVAFVGRLVPYKGADMLIEAAAPLIRAGAVVLDIIGDGPEGPRLDALIERERLQFGITRPGWVEHVDLQARLGRADVLGFPSVREFGGGVVLEAMALGVVPIVIDYGGPGELVTPSTGVAIPMAPRGQLVERLRAALRRFVEHPETVLEMSIRGRDRVLSHFTWEAKARQVLEVYRWVLGHRTSKPDFGLLMRSGAPEATR